MSMIAPILFILMGFILILLEILVMPGLITGILGFGLIVWGIVDSYKTFGNTGAAIAVAASLITGAGLFYLMLRLKVWRRFVLESRIDSRDGDVSPDHPLSTVIGKEGTAHSFLRPSGQVMIGQEKYDAMTEGQFLEKGTAVTVLRIQGQQLIVEKK